MWIVYTEILNGTPNPERWYYGRYSNVDKANEVAIELGNDSTTYHCVCNEEMAEKLNIKNIS